MDKVYVQYGCGLSAPPEWVNFDSSPTLKIQKTPLIGKLLAGRLNTKFPPNVKYGDIVKGLPVTRSSCDGIYCSHVLEHLSLHDFRLALLNTYKILKPGGIFRCVVPDLEYLANNYLAALKSDPEKASITFMGKDSLLGAETRARGIKGMMVTWLGNARHLWMWDKHSLAAELRKAGFTQIRRADFNDSEIEAFKLVEDRSRFVNAVALECTK